MRRSGRGRVAGEREEQTLGLEFLRVLGSRDCRTEVGHR
jgi:hypothetical protein